MSNLNQTRTCKYILLELFFSLLICAGFLSFHRMGNDPAFGRGLFSAMLRSCRLNLNCRSRHHPTHTIVQSEWASRVGSCFQSAVVNTSKKSKIFFQQSTSNLGSRSKVACSLAFGFMHRTAENTTSTTESNRYSMRFLFHLVVFTMMTNALIACWLHGMR
mgnify:CR=1 FL=1